MKQKCLCVLLVAVVCSEVKRSDGLGAESEAVCLHFKWVRFWKIHQQIVRLQGWGLSHATCLVYAANNKRIKCNQRRCFWYSLCNYFKKWKHFGKIICSCLRAEMWQACFVVARTGLGRRWCSVQAGFKPVGVAVSLHYTAGSQSWRDAVWTEIWDAGALPVYLVFLNPDIQMKYWTVKSMKVNLSFTDTLSVWYSRLSPPSHLLPPIISESRTGCQRKTSDWPDQVSIIPSSCSLLLANSVHTRSQKVKFHQGHKRGRVHLSAQSACSHHVSRDTSGIWLFTFLNLSSQVFFFVCFF